MKNNLYKTLRDPVFLRYVAQNDYMVDGGFLPEGQRLNDIADRLDALVTVENMEDKVVEEIHRESEDLRERIAELEAEVDKCIRDRDEARREVCGMNESGLRMNDSDKQREAKRRGWDCFKEKTDE